jgi:hypothetical protein
MDVLYEEKREVAFILFSVGAKFRTDIKNMQ